MTVEALRGIKYFKLLRPLLKRLRPDGTRRDRAGNRQLYFDHYLTLLLLYFFSPTLTSLRGLQAATELEAVRRRLGVPRVALGSLSEAAHVFDPALLREVVAELAGRALEAAPRRDRAKLRDLIAVDGSLLPALPRMAWATWQDDRNRAAKMHVAFEVVRGAPVDATVTAGNAPEREELRRLARPGGFYVFDRGYADYGLFQELHDAGCEFLGRVQGNAAYEVAEERPLSAADAAAGVVRDLTIRRLGTGKHNALLPQPWRVVVVATGGADPDGTPGHLVLVTNRMGWPAELVALGYRYRWSVELFFRWLKCILGCRHLISEGPEGVTLQVYAALIASLLIGLWAGRPPTKRTYELVCFYLSGWASEAEMMAHIEKLHGKDPPADCKA